MAASLVLICRQAGREAAMSVSVMHIRNSIRRTAGVVVPATTRQQRWLSSQNDANSSRSVLKTPQQKEQTSVGPIVRRVIDGFELCSIDESPTQGSGGGGGTGSGASKSTITGATSSSNGIFKDGQNPELEPRPVVVMISWLNARRKHLRKYQELYWMRGFDVLTMDVSPVHVVWPVSGVRYTEKLAKVLQEHEDLANRKVVFHGFSIAAFIYTQLQLLLHKQQQQQPQQHQQPLQQGDRLKQALLQPLHNPHQPQYHHHHHHQHHHRHHHDHKALQGSPPSPSLESRIAGLVLDSPAYMDHMCSGIANSVTKIPAVRKLINNSLLLYLYAFPKSVTFHYQESERIFHHNDVPTLIIYSDSDLISSAETSERYMREWQGKGFTAVSTLKLPDTEHVSHFRKYPAEYEQAVDSFLRQLDLVPQPEVTSVEDELPQVQPAVASAAAAAASATAATSTPTAAAAAAAAEV